MNNKILVTGGAGFTGSNLCEELLLQGKPVICLDNFATGKPGNISPFLTATDFQLIVGDVRNPDDCRKATEGIEYVFHEVVPGSVPRSIKDPITSNEANVSGFLHMNWVDALTRSG